MNRRLILASLPFPRCYTNRSQVRNYIVVGDTPGTRAFCIAYDTLVTKPFFRNQAILLFCSLNGFFENAYFALMLLDVANISVTVQVRKISPQPPPPQPQLNKGLRGRVLRASFPDPLVQQLATSLA